MTYNELYHHGILGMKWGKRNGPPYPLSSSQKSSSEKRQAKAGRYLTQDIKGGKDRPNKSAAEVITGETAKVAKDIGSATRTIQKIRKKDSSYYNEQIKTMSDDELIKAIKRLDLERRYRDLIVSKDSDVEKGRDYIIDFLDVVGSIASASLSAATIMSVLYGMKNK